MSLDRYNQMRDFDKSPEPQGKLHTGDGHTYIIQKHDASHLHYDFRLEIDGVLKSWAIPKGPSLDPSDKRLAVNTEDHPLDYADFEGVIPEGYGAGTVMLWDTGRWEADGDLSKGFAKGKMNFKLQGQRLRGNWSLVRMNKRGKNQKNQWLLIKQDDQYASDLDPTEKYSKSVVTQRRMETIAKGRKTVNDIKQHDDAEQTADPAEQLQAPTSGKHKRSSTAAHSLAELKKSLRQKFKLRKSAFPHDVTPQLATLYQNVPTDQQWLHEVKYDGYRLLVEKDKSAKLLTRNRKDWTKKFEGFHQEFEGLPRCLLDGELVYLAESGIANFEKLQNVLRSGDTRNLFYYAFDLLYLDGYDLRGLPLIERKSLLRNILSSNDSPRLRYSEHFEGAGEQVWQQACEHQLEGIVCKDAQDHYHSRRTRGWRKVRCDKRQEFVIVGFTAPQRSRSGFGALLLGYYEHDQLRYAGKVGTGFDSKQLNEIHAHLRRIQRKRSPLSEATEEEDSAITWVSPNTVCEVKFTEWTRANRLRHPSFIELREDKPAKEIVREIPSEAELPQSSSDRGENRGSSASDDQRKQSSTASAMTHPDKILFDDAGLSKQDLADYYHTVSEHMLPTLRERPLTLVRCPRGHKQHCFFQKHLENQQGHGLSTVTIKEKSSSAEYAYVDDAAGLTELVQLGTLEVHSWGSRVDKVDSPDLVIFDLDPDPSVEWSAVKEAAQALRTFLQSLNLTSFLRTTGGKGLHLVVPLSRRHNWEEIKAFAKAVAQHFAEKEPEKYIAVASKSKRKGKVFIDYLRNSRGATSISNYSTRAKPGAPVATPLRWDELDRLQSAADFNVGNIPRRLAQLNDDPWSKLNKTRQSITKNVKEKLGI